MKASFNTLAAAIETAAMPPILPDAAPRYVVVARDGKQFLLDENRRVLFTRRANGLPAEPVVGETRAPKNVAAERDLWWNGSSPRHNPDSAWSVRAELRVWRLWHQ